MFRLNSSKTSPCAATQLEPQDPGNYYRLAAVRLLLGKTDEARKAIEEAGAHDLLARESSRHYLSARAIVDMDLNLSHGERKEAVCAIDVARAVARGGDEERCRLAEEFKKTNIYRRLEIKAEQARDFEDLSLSPIYTMLFESLGLKDSVIEKPEAKEPPPVPPPEAANRDKTGQHTGAD
jgi:hypothetical protein